VYVNADKIIIAVDPGISGGCGIACLEQTAQGLWVRSRAIYPEPRVRNPAWSVLRQAGVVLGEWLRGEKRDVQVVFERPQKYEKRRSTHRAVELLDDFLNDLQPIFKAVHHAEVTSGKLTFQWVKPFMWKRNIPKHIHQERAKAAHPLLFALAEDRKSVV
jgi:hypothetical protein